MPTAADQPEKKPAPVVAKHPELLMASREGDPVRLSVLLNEPVVAWTAIRIQEDDGDGNPVSHAEAVTSGLDSILHVVASGGDSDRYLESASVIHSKARHLLDAGNGEGDTPLHCAAKAGRIEMVSHLIRLARAEAGDKRVEAALRKQNKLSETVLHEAVRLADEEMVERLMSADSQLARVPEVDGASPLYLAVSLGHYGIAEQLHNKDEGLSYCGPDGQNVLHAAVLHKSTRMTDMLLKWGKLGLLIKQGDRPHGRTPLHLAASRGVPETVIALLEADKSSAYQYDDEGSLPIHVAAMENAGDIVRVFLDVCPGCAEARDTKGRTFLHVAIDNSNSALVWSVFRYFRGRGPPQVERFETILNMRDGDGNTGLHLAVQTRSAEIFYCLLWNKGIQLNSRNNMGKTALDLLEKPVGINFWLDPQLMMLSLLEAAGAECGYHNNGFPHLDEEKEAKMISDSVPVIGIISALLVTVSFAAAFAVPGGYRAGDDTKSGAPPGTPVLAATYSFQGFVVANNLALLCATLATVSLAYAGVTKVTIRTRMYTFSLSIFFLHGSARSLAAAFAFGTDAALARVARATAIVTWLGMSLTFLDVIWLVCTLALVQLLLLKRLGPRAYLRVAVVILVLALWALWPYIIILGQLAYYKIHGIH